MLKKCLVCELPVQVRETDMCAPCTFGEAGTLDEFDFEQYEPHEVPADRRMTPEMIARAMGEEP